MPKPEPTGTVSINEPGPYAINDKVTFTVSTDGIHGKAWPMVYLECRSVVDDEVLYGQLDYHNVEFLIGGGSSPWREGDNVGQDAVGVAKLYVYSKNDDPILLAQTESFPVSG